MAGSASTDDVSTTGSSAVCSITGSDFLPFLPFFLLGCGAQKLSSSTGWASSVLRASGARVSCASESCVTATSLSWGSVSSALTGSCGSSVVSGVLEPDFLPFLPFFFFFELGAPQNSSATSVGSTVACGAVSSAVGTTVCSSTGASVLSVVSGG